MRVELKGHLLEAETESCEGKVQHRPGLTEWEACEKSFCFYYHLPSFKTRCLTRILDLTGFDGREYGKDTWRIFCLIRKQTRIKCWKEASCWSSQTHAYTTHFRNTQEDSRKLNGWQPTETKRVLTRTCKLEKAHFLVFPTRLRERRGATITGTKQLFFQIST